jgi:hypothetical protein
VTIIAKSLKRGGLLTPLQTSAGVSAAATVIASMVEHVREQFEASLVVREAAETALRALRRVSAEASAMNWDGEGAHPVDARAVREAARLIAALPTTVPAPDVGADPDGEVDLLWHCGTRRTLSVSVGAGGRLTYSALVGEAQSYGTEWFVTEIPDIVLHNLYRVLNEPGSRVG